MAPPPWCDVSTRWEKLPLPCSRGVLLLFPVPYAWHQAGCSGDWLHDGVQITSSEPNQPLPGLSVRRGEVRCHTPSFSGPAPQVQGWGTPPADGRLPRGTPPAAGRLSGGGTPPADGRLPWGGPLPQTAGSRGGGTPPAAGRLPGGGGEPSLRQQSERLGVEVCRAPVNEKLEFRDLRGGAHNSPGITYSCITNLIRKGTIL